MLSKEIMEAFAARAEMSVEDLPADTSFIQPIVSSFMQEVLTFWLFYYILNLLTMMLVIVTSVGS
jgi:hypothetical protein